MNAGVLLLALLVLVAGTLLFFQQPATTPSPDSSQGCDESLWSHVYNPARLQVIDRCRTVAGTIASIRKEPDGDYHIQLKLDAEFAGLVNAKNVEGQNGNLVLEPVCQNPVTQTDAVDACNGFEGQVVVPKAGTHVQVTGSYVLDKQHGWMEIHPVTGIKAA